MVSDPFPTTLVLGAWLNDYHLISAYPEPTSALDSETALRVEEFLTNRVNSELTKLRALVWITHSPEQGRRIGTRFVQFSGGTCAEDSPTSSISV